MSSIRHASTFITAPRLYALSRTLSQSPAPNLTFLIGGPGAGKGTLGAMVQERLNWGHVSVGELLRRQVEVDSALGREIAPVINSGGIVCSSISIHVLLNHLKEGGLHNWLVDGFPRKLKNAYMWHQLAIPNCRVIALRASEDVMMQRLKNRGREDDVPQIVQNRLDSHRKEWGLLKQFYTQQNQWIEIDGNGTPEDTWHNFVQIIHR